MDDSQSQSLKADTPLISYAQNFEDVMLWRALGDIAGGFYIDVGAQDPLIDSVSLGFYEKGWRGVHVEPTPHYAAKLREARPDETVVQAAIAATPGQLRFYEIVETGLSTADPDHAETHRRHGFTILETDVPALTLGSLLDSHASRPIHWLKIDVEGLEQQVIESWGESPVRPWLVVVESTLPGTQTSSGAVWEPLLVSKGYQPVYFDGLNRYYLSDQQRDRAHHFQAGPNCFDNFVLNGSATNRFCRLLNNRLDEQRDLVAHLRGLLDENHRQLEARQTALVQLHGSLEQAQSAHGEAVKAHAEAVAQAALERQAGEAERQWILREKQAVELQLAQTLASRSWRLTKPIRAAGDFARRLRRLSRRILGRLRRIGQPAPQPPANPDSLPLLPARALALHQRLLARQRAALRRGPS